MHPTGGVLGEGGNRSTEGGAPALVREIVVPVCNDQTGWSAEEDAEIGVSVEEPLAGAGDVRYVGLVRAKAGLEVLGTWLHRQERDAEAEPPTGTAEAGQTQGSALSGGMASAGTTGCRLRRLHDCGSLHPMSPLLLAGASHLSQERTLLGVSCHPPGLPPGCES